MSGAKSAKVPKSDKSSLPYCEANYDLNVLCADETPDILAGKAGKSDTDSKGGKSGSYSFSYGNKSGKADADSVSVTGGKCGKSGGDAIGCPACTCSPGGSYGGKSGGAKGGKSGSYSFSYGNKAGKSGSGSFSYSNKSGKSCTCKSPTPCGTPITTPPPPPVCVCEEVPFFLSMYGTCIRSCDRGPDGGSFTSSEECCIARGSMNEFMGSPCPINDCGTIPEPDIKFPTVSPSSGSTPLSAQMPQGLLPRQTDRIKIRRG